MGSWISTPPPPAPTHVVAEPAGLRGLLQFNDVEGANFYQVYVYEVQSAAALNAINTQNVSNIQPAHLTARPHLDRRIPVSRFVHDGFVTVFGLMFRPANRVYYSFRVSTIIGAREGAESDPLTIPITPTSSLHGSLISGVGGSGGSGIHTPGHSAAPGSAAHIGGAAPGAVGEPTPSLPTHSAGSGVSASLATINEIEIGLIKPTNFYAAPTSHAEHQSLLETKQSNTE